MLTHVEHADLRSDLLDLLAIHAGRIAVDDDPEDPDLIAATAAVFAAARKILAPTALKVDAMARHDGATYREIGAWTDTSEQAAHKRLNRG